MERRFDELGRAFLAAFETADCINRELTHIRPLPLSVSTITFTGSLNVSAIDLSDVALGLRIGAMAAEADTPFRLGRIGGNDDNSDEDNDAPARPAKKRGKRKQKFQNQLPLVTPAGKAVKLFHNGSIHVTGCGSAVEFLAVVESLCAFLPSVASLPPLRLDAFDTQMINMNFLITNHEGQHIRLRPKRLRAALSEDRGPVDFETERHPGIKLTVREAGAKVATVMLFQTGSVQVSGAKRPEHVALAYRDAVTRLDAAVASLGSDVCVAAPTELRTTTARQMFYIQDGYPATLFNACLAV